MSNPVGPSFGAPKKTHVIVIGNEKGGSGKTTSSMHLIVALLRLGFKIGSIDIDSRQRSLSRYLENRKNTMERHKAALPLPQHFVVQRSPFNVVDEAEADERERMTKAINKLKEENDFIVIDSPGSDTYLSRLAHSHADTIITPINDSFVDLDVLASVDGQTLKVVKPSIYSEMVWEQKLLRAKRDGGSIEWIVMRNRLSNIDARNKRFMSQVLAELSRRIGFRAAPGFSERVIFREMFLQGLTVLDVMDTGKNSSISLSHIAARQEVRDLLKILRIPKVDERIAQIRANESGDKGIAAAEPTKVVERPGTAPNVAVKPAPQPVVGGQRVSTPASPAASAQSSAPKPAAPMAPASAPRPAAAAISPAAHRAPMSPLQPTTATPKAPESAAQAAMRSAATMSANGAGDAIRTAANNALRQAAAAAPTRPGGDHAPASPGSASQGLLKRAEQA